jgi:kynurenine formamidase
MFRLLSYPLSNSSPVWPGNPPAAQTEAFSSIAAGNSSNTTVLHLFSHSGTHLDAPKHFNDQGATAVELPIETYIFFSPLILEIAKPEGGLIELAEVEPYAEQLATADLALLRTGWSSVRASDPQRYVSEGPLLHPDAARFLLENYPQLKGVAIDAVSIGAPNYRTESRETHRILTGVNRADGHFLLILEDLRIDSDLGQAVRIYAWPLLIEGSDGSPCTIVAEFRS